MNVFYKIQPRFLYCVPYISLYNQVEKAVLQQIPRFLYCVPYFCMVKWRTRFYDEDEVNSFYE